MAVELETRVHKRPEDLAFVLSKALMVRGSPSDGDGQYFAIGHRLLAEEEDAAARRGSGGGARSTHTNREREATRPRTRVLVQLGHALPRPRP